jgi:mannose-6-phosphate isomerase-like protein (cupin superfamily)
MSMEALEQTTSFKQAKVAGDKAHFFTLRTQLLDQGRSDTEVARTDNMWARIKVYASGGENGLHCHPVEDHMFVVMDGSARFYDAEGGHRDIARHEGIMLPARVYYWFEATSKEPLVLMRIGCRTGAGSSQGRLNSKGEPMAGNSEENKTVPRVYRPGAFFE